MTKYSPQNWYWAVGGDEARVYSSASAAYVPVADATYKAWVDAGNVPTRIDTEANLFDVLASAHPPGLGTLGTPAQQAGLLRGGTTVTLTSASTPALDGEYPITRDSLADIAAIQTGLTANQVPGGGSTFSYPAGSSHQFTPAQFTQFATAVLNYVWGLAACEAGQVPTLPSRTLTIP